MERCGDLGRHGPRNGPGHLPFPCLDDKSIVYCNQSLIAVFHAYLVGCNAKYKTSLRCSFFQPTPVVSFQTLLRRKVQPDDSNGNVTHFQTFKISIVNVN